jgi:hypothetical protein
MPKGPWYELANGDTTVEIGGWLYKPRSKQKKPEIRIAQRIKDSPDKGGPHMMFLQNRDGRILRPTGYMIFEVWRLWKLTITITRDTWVNGEHTSHSVTRESTQWKELVDRYKVMMEAPGIWEQFGVAPFGKLKGIIAQFPLPEHFNPANWTLISHITAKDTINGKDVIRTVPVVAMIGQGKKSRLTFKTAPAGKTAYQREHGCESELGSIKADVQRVVPAGKAGKGRKPSRYKVKKVKMDAAHWGRIVILQPPLSNPWLAAYHQLPRRMQRAAVLGMADLVLRMMTGMGTGGDWNRLQWLTTSDVGARQVQNLVIEAVNQWKHGMDGKQQAELSRIYSRLSPALKQVFKREFIKTLATNLLLDLRQPSPIAY